MKYSEEAGDGALQAAGIFISYRRSDAAGHAGRLFDRLSRDNDVVRMELAEAALEGLEG